jgi:hypothetical protein
VKRRALTLAERQRRAEVARAVADYDEAAACGEPPRPLVAYDDDDMQIVVMRCEPWYLDPAMYEIETRNILARYGERYRPLHLLPPALRDALVEKWAARELADDARNPKMSKPDSDEEEDDY